MTIKSINRLNNNFNLRIIYDLNLLDCNDTNYDTGLFLFSKRMKLFCEIIFSNIKLLFSKSIDLLFFICLFFPSLKKREFIIFE